MSTSTQAVSIVPALSDDWRTRPSNNRAIDMANALRSIQKVIAAVDTRECEVSFNTFAESHFAPSDKKLHIRIDPAFAMKTAPIQGKDFDVLAGLGVHEGLHAECHSDEIRTHGTDAYKGVTTIGEEIYVDNYAKRNLPVLGKYIHLSREAYKPNDDQVDWGDIYMTWAAIAVYGIMPQGTWLSDVKKVAMLQLLMETSTLLMDKNLTPQARQKIYEETAGKLEGMLARQKIEDDISNKPQEPELDLEAPKGMVNIQMPGSNGNKPETDEEGDDDAEANDTQGGDKATQADSAKGNEEEEDGEGNKTDSSDSKGVSNTGKNGDTATEGQDSDDSDGNESDSSPPQIIDLGTLLHPQTSEVPTELASKIVEVLELGIEDITETLDQTFGMSVSGSDTVVWSKATTPLDNSFNKELARQLVWVKDYKNTKGHQTYRNEPRGRLDPSRLYKAPINGLVFKRKLTLPMAELDLVMLLDASGSMGRNNPIYEDAKALHQTIPDAVILSYEDSSEINIVHHNEGRALRQIVSKGGTPTPEAIAATAMKYPNSMIIHFTDGGCDKRKLETILHKVHELYPKVKIVNVQLASAVSGYGGNEIPEVDGVSRTIVMESIEDFPTKLKGILREW